MTRKNHFSPKLANKAWRLGKNYTHYYRDEHSGAIKTEPKGWQAWGQRTGLWSDEVEDNLANELENGVAAIYRKIVACNDITAGERQKWAQFILSQAVRTPTFMRYEKFAAEKIPGSVIPEHDRIGCEECGDLYWLTQRNWFLVVCEEDGLFVRSDNPVLMTGFADRSKTVVFYPLAPRILWMAYSMPDGWAADWRKGHAGNFSGYVVPKAASSIINFHFIKAAQNEIIVHPDHDADYLTRMAEDVLGRYPQPPFSLHILDGCNESDAFESVRLIMSACDRVVYPVWSPSDLEPFYGKVAA